MKFLIDERSPYAPMEELRSFLKQMEELPQNDLEVQMAVEHAKREIARREAKEEARTGRQA